MLTECSDKELVVNIQNGCKASFQEIFSRYSEKAYHLALRISRKQEDAEEIVQDTFLNVYSKISSFQGKSAFSSWLYRITFNTALMKLRKRKKHASMPLEENWFNAKESSLRMNVRSEQTDINFISVRHELRKNLETAINGLPEDYKQIFILRDIDGLSNGEVSEIVGATIPAVKSRLHRARVMLKANLAKYHQDYRSETVILEGMRIAA